MNNRLILLLFASFLFRVNVLGQSIDSSLNVYNTLNTQEKLHIHFDKDAYLPGETVWMKAYLMSDARPSTVSKNLYFDWTDADGRLLLHSIAPITEGGASSFFKIPAWVKNGVIHIKDYTQWMLNFDNAFLYNKDIPVLMPVVHQLGINGVHFGLIMVLNLMIGLLHPPMGMVLFVLARIANLSFERTTIAILPWLVPLLLALILVTYVPAISLWLPHLFY